MATKMALEHLEQFFANQNKPLKKFVPNVRRIEQQMNPTEIRMVNFINKRIEEE